MDELDLITTLEDFAALPCCLPSFHPSYQHPTSKHLNKLFELSGIKKSDVPLIVGIKVKNNGSTTTRLWFLDERHKNFKTINYASWRLLIEYVGCATTQQTREVINCSEYRDAHFKSLNKS